MTGSSDDCRKCACPLTTSSNNFSPTCVMKESNGISLEASLSSDYICDKCSVGHVGKHCESCEDGYYGNPTELGSRCLPCPCNGDPSIPRLESALSVNATSKVGVVKGARKAIMATRPSAVMNVSALIPAQSVTCAIRAMESAHASQIMSANYVINAPLVMQISRCNARHVSAIEMDQSMRHATR